MRKGLLILGILLLLALAGALALVLLRPGTLPASGPKPELTS